MKVGIVNLMRLTITIRVKKKTQAMLVGDYLDWLIEVEQSIVNTVGTVHGLRY